MRLDKIDLNLFVVFDAIYRERSVTKAAVQLNLTQPAISNALSRLRDAFDDPLFVRSPEGMSPTPVSDNIVTDIRNALALLGKTIDGNVRFDPKTSEKTFHLGMNDLAESLLLAGIHKMVKATAPAISLTSHYAPRDTLAEELKSGLIDLLIDAPIINAKELGQQSLAALPYVVAMRRRHPLTRKKISVDDYLAAEHLHVSSRRKGRGQMDIALHKLGYRRRVVMRVQNYLVAAQIVKETDLLWTVPKVLADTLPVATQALPFTVDALEWSLFWHRHASNDPANQWIRSVILDIVNQTLG